MPSQIAFYSLVISQGVQDGGLVSSNITIRGRTSYTTSALLAATTFGAEIRAHNPLGVSQWSERLVATTAIPVRSPLQPPAPIVETDDQKCDVFITIKLPEVEYTSRGDSEECAGLERYELQTISAGTTSWRTLVPHSTASRLTVHAPLEISAAKAHRFRIVSTNRVGVSLPGEASAPIVGGLPLSLLRPPTVRTTSSASFAVQLPASHAPCLGNLVWTVLGRVESHAWRVLGTGLQGSSVVLEQLRCPKQGCEFKLQPDIHAFAGTVETPSVFATNAKLPQVAPKEARIEVRLSGTTWNSLIRSQLGAELKAWLRLRADASVVEGHVNERAGDTAVVVDLPGPYSNETAQELARLLRTDAPIPEDYHVLTRLQRSDGVQQMAESGDWHLLVVTTAEQHFDPWGTLGAVFSVVVTIGLSARCVFAIRAAWHRRMQLRGAIPLAMSEEDADEVEQQGEHGGRQERIATVDLDMFSKQIDADDDFPA